MTNSATKFQLTVPEDLLRELKEEAERQGIPLAQWMREVMTAKLAEARAQRKHDGGAPLSRLVGLMNTGETDISSRVDEILYS